MKIRCVAWKHSALLAGVLSFLCAACKQKELEPTPPELARPAAIVRPALQFQPVAGATDGVKEAILIKQSLPQLHSRLEIRTLVVQAGKPVTLLMEHEGLLEVRAGILASGTENNLQQRHRGEMWQVAKGEHVVLRASGELAVFRALYLISGDQ
jgi:hypothetical protein